MNLDNFTNKAEAYAKGRPGYPREAFEKIIELASPESVFAYVESQDDSPLSSDPGYDSHIVALNAMFDRDSVDGLLRCDRVTKIYSEMEVHY